MTIFLPTDMSASGKTNMDKNLGLLYKLFKSYIKFALEGTLADDDDLVLRVPYQDALYHLQVVRRSARYDCFDATFLELKLKL